jgi:hypothetical protein
MSSKMSAGRFVVRTEIRKTKGYTRVGRRKRKKRDADRPHGTCCALNSLIAVLMTCCMTFRDKKFEEHNGD